MVEARTPFQRNFWGYGRVMVEAKTPFQRNFRGYGRVMVEAKTPFQRIFLEITGDNYAENTIPTHFSGDNRR